MTYEEFKQKKEKAEKTLCPGEKLIIREPVFEETTGEVLYDGAVYKVFGECKYRTQDNPIDANLDTEVQKGVSVADFSDYVDNRDVILALMKHSQNTGMSLRRYVSDLSADDGFTEAEFDEDYDLDELDDLELMTMQNEASEAIANAVQQSGHSKQEEADEKDESHSDKDDEEASSSVE